MRRTVMPVDMLFAWGKLNGVEFNHIDIKDITSNDGPSKGAGLTSASDRNKSDDGSILIAVPQELILSKGQVELYAAVDKHLKLILDAAGAFGKVSALNWDMDLQVPRRPWPRSYARSWTYGCSTTESAWRNLDILVGPDHKRES
jgi:hypothetical protein